MKKPKPLTAISTFAIFLAMVSTTAIFNVSAVDAQQDSTEGVDGYGVSIGRFTCANGERPPTGETANRFLPPMR